MSNFLAVDTSSRYLTVAARKGGKTETSFIPECAMRHSVILMDEIDKVLKKLDLAPAECDFFAAVTGPGSFTGIRIGVATVKGFALAAGKPVKAVTAFDLLSYNIKSKKYFVVIDAAHSHYYVCGYADGQISLKPCYLSEAEVNSLDGEKYGFEDLTLGDYRKIDVASCLLPAAEGAAFTDKLHALYVRKSQAEENLNATERVEI